MLNESDAVILWDSLYCTVMEADKRRTIPHPALTGKPVSISNRAVSQTNQLFCISFEAATPKKQPTCFKCELEEASVVCLYS